MKIVKMEKIEDGNFIKISQSELSPVKLFLKSFWGIYSTMLAYPTNYGPTYGSGSVIYFYFCDENGNELSDKISKQINNFLRIGLINSKQ